MYIMDYVSNMYLVYEHNGITLRLQFYGKRIFKQHNMRRV